MKVDGRSLYGYTNHQAVEVLRNTGKIVKLRLARYLRGSKYEQLQQAIANPDLPVPYYPQSTPGATVIQIFDQSTDPNATTQSFVNAISEISVQDNTTFNGQSSDDLINKWEKIMGPNYDIVVSIETSSLLYIIEVSYLWFCFI